MNELESWGTPPTKVLVEDRGECIDFHYLNEYSTYDIPNGWEIITDNWLVVQEGARALITICQMGMS